MTYHTTHLTSEAMPEPGELRRVVSVHAGNRTYETVPVGHDTGWLVAAPHSTNPVYWTDEEVSEVHNGWVVKDGVPAMVLSRHGDLPEPEPALAPALRFRRSRRARATEPEPSPEPEPGIQSDAVESATEEVSDLES
jgi:hypothetical protein